MKCIYSEPLEPSNTSLEIINKAIHKIKPDIESLYEWYALYAKGQKKRLAFDIDHIQSLNLSKASILEIGSIPPILMAGLKSLNLNVQGVDISPERFQQSIQENGLMIRKTNIETESLEYTAGSFDIVILNEVFEHLRINLIDTFQEIHRVLKPEGVLMLSTPNFFALNNLASFILHKKSREDLYIEYSKINYLGHMGHVRLYTHVEICQFLEKLNFKIEKVIFRGSSVQNTWARIFTNRLLLLIPMFRPHYTIFAKKLDH